METVPPWVPEVLREPYSYLGLAGSIASIIGLIIVITPLVYLKCVPQSWRSAITALVHDVAERAVRYLPNLIMVAGACALGLITRSGYRQGADSVVGAAALFGVAIIWWQEYRYGRKAAYAEAMRDLHAAVHNLRDAHENLERSGDEEFIKQICTAAELIARAFSVVTRTSCRACVKAIVPPPNTTPDALRAMTEKELTHHLLVKVLARSSSSVQREPARADYLDENSDFLTLFRDPEVRCFLSNDLERSFRKQHYRNPGIPEGFNVASGPWPLVYRSTFVWPIRKRVRKSDVNPKQHLLGYLCVDSRARRIFVHRYDFDMGAIVADALYVYMKRYFELHQYGRGGDGENRA